jgi:RNA polymerase sigma-70 factor (ECF subfamily)
MDAHEITDAEISRGCRQNNSEDWRRLVRTYTPLVYRISLRMLRDRQEAEDASQEVFMNVFRSISSHDPTRPLAPWLARITYNSCLKRLSKIKLTAERGREFYKKDLHDDYNSITPEDRMDNKLKKEKVVSALDRLSAQDRALVIMRYREGFSDSEISESTNMPVGTVKTRLHRTRKHLKKLLAPLMNEDPVS